MMKSITLVSLALLISCFAYSQDKFFTKEGQISFYSKAPLEDIEAFSKNANAILDSGTGEVIARVSIKTFEFEKKLMQEHFNENYLESDKYPRGEFKGTLKNFNLDMLSENKETIYTAEGSLSIHGKSKDISVPVKLKRINGKMQASAEFKIRLKDFNIKIPKVVIRNIAEEIKINFDFEMTKLN